MYKFYNLFMMLVGAGLAALSIMNIEKANGQFSLEYLWAALGIVVAIGSRIKLGKKEEDGW